MIPLLVSNFAVSINPKHSPGLYALYKKPTQILGNVLCPMLAKNKYAAVPPG